MSRVLGVCLALTSTLWGAQAQTHIEGGGAHSLALRPDGTVWAVGDNGEGQLGDNTTSHRTVQVQVQGLSGVESVSAGDSHSLALRLDCLGWAWGSNAYGQLGNGGHTLYTTTPTLSWLY